MSGGWPRPDRWPWLSTRFWRLKWRSLTDRGGLDRELRDEMAAHVEMETEAGVARGLAPAEARRRALASFGGVERYRQQAQEQWGFRWIDDARRDFGHAVRSFARNPVFTLVTVLTLALGLGANTAVFSVLDGVLLEPPAFAEADRLVVVWETDRASGNFHEPASVPDFLDFRQRAGSFVGLSAFRGAEVTFRGGGGEPRRLAALSVTPELPHMVGIDPLLGRPLRAGDAVPGAAPAVWVSEDFWRNAFASDPEVVGTVVEVDEEPHLLAGVMPRGAEFGFHQVLARADYGRAFADDGQEPVSVWLPFAADPEALPRHTHPIVVLGRLAPGLTPEAAGEEVAAIAADLEAAYPENRNRGARVEPLTEVALGPVRPALWLLLAVSAVVLLIACLNVVSLLLARSVSRRRELAVRSALGAGSRRLARQFLVEGLVLGTAAAALGTAGAWFALVALRARVPAALAPRLGEVGLAPVALAATLAAAVLLGVLCGLVPWFQARRSVASGALAGGARGATGDPGRSRLRGLLVVAEVALAVVLVVAAGLLLRSFLSVTGVDLGFRAAGLVKGEVALPAARYPTDYSVWPDWPEIHAASASFLERLEAIPGVASAALAGSHPLDAGFTNSFVIEGREAEAASQPEISIRQVSPSYFETVGMPLLAGRGLAPSDRQDTGPVAVLNRAAVRRFFPDEDPLGQRLAFWGVSREVVGVVGDERFLGAMEEAPPALYGSLGQMPANNLNLLLRSDRGGDAAASLAPALRRAAAEVDPALAVSGVETLEQTFGRSVARLRFTAGLVGLFSGLALLLALVGVHGVLAYTVAQRRRELGIRMALGAARRDVLAMVLGSGLRVALAGLALGMLGALATTRFLSSLLFEVEATDLVTLGGVAGAVLLTALGAALAPAISATRTDPARTLSEG